MRTRAGSKGFTAIEVMLALTIFTIGATGVISMQRTAIKANLDARRQDQANALAREWVERLRRDAAMWTLPNTANPSSNIATALLLKGTVNGKWHLPARTGDTEVSAAADVLGVDQAVYSAANSSVLFCTHIRLTFLMTDELIKAEVRVFWTRGLDTTPAAGFCSESESTIGDPPTATDTAKYHFVYAVSAIRRNPL